MLGPLKLCNLCATLNHFLGVYRKGLGVQNNWLRQPLKIDVTEKNKVHHNEEHGKRKQMAVSIFSVDPRKWFNLAHKLHNLRGPSVKKLAWGEGTFDPVKVWYAPGLLRSQGAIIRFS